MALWLAVAVAGTFPPATSAQSTRPAAGTNASAATDSATRTIVPLIGTWQQATAPAADNSPPASGWQDRQVPWSVFTSPANGAKSVWFRRDITIPNDLGNRRVFVDLRAARYQPLVYVDGKLIGGGTDGWAPTIVEITQAVRAGSTHSLAVRCHDRSIFFPEGFVLTPEMTNEQKRGKTLSLIGGFHDRTGITDRVFLRISPATLIDTDTLNITTSTRKETLAVSGRIDGSAQGLTVRAAALSGDAVALELPDAQVGQDGTFNVQAAFPSAKHWSPENPHLYHLRLTLVQDGKVLDTFTQRFGFKEVWVSGSDFYLNGVKRRLLASSTWPDTDFVDPSVIRDRIRNIKNNNVNAFRLHIGGWQEDWMDAADELGLMIIPEAACYTDGDGFYAYLEPQFWRNYEKHVKEMILRDRNHASVIMWSLGNEILFMGNERHDPQLPKKLGDLARFARNVDPHRPLTMEADLDPDGAFDIIGLHYPHEMPSQRNYPNTADWLARRINTEAAGGMLGQQGTEGFLWDRNKPLYIGEYLWTPQGDYSNSTIWFGDDAFLNRGKYHGDARILAWHDQTLAYRRAGVTGVCPWTVYGFGGIADPTSSSYLAQKDFYKPVAAYWRNRGLRYFSGTTAELSFDVFNDSVAPADFELIVRSTDPNSALKPVSAKVRLEPAGYAKVPISLVLPDSDSDQVYAMESVLMSSGVPVDTQTRQLRTFTRKNFTAPPGMQLIVLDPSGAWPGSVRSLPAPAQLDVAKTLVLIANERPAEPAAGDTATAIGRPRLDFAPLREFLKSGGRAVVLEQSSVEALGLGVSSGDHPSTMSFPLLQNHPILKGLNSADLSYWAPDNFVTEREILRPASGGAKPISVTGGTEWLSHSPIVDVPYGRGRVILIQTLAGAKRDIEPAAARIIQNAIDLVGTPTSAESSATAKPATPAATTATGNTTALLAQAPEFGAAVRSIGVEVGEAVTDDTRLLLLSGGGSRIESAASSVDRILAQGGTVYWHAPTPEAFAALAKSIGADGLVLRPAQLGLTLHDRAHPLLDGVAREDLTATSSPIHWDRKMTFLPTSAMAFVESATPGAMKDVPLATAELKDATRAGSAIRFDRRGWADVALTSATPGLHTLIFNLSTAKAGENNASIMLEVNKVESVWFQVPPGSTGPITVQLPLKAGENHVRLHFVNGADWGSDRTLEWTSLQVSESPALPQRVQSLTVPASILTWNVGPGKVVIDNFNWTAKWPGVANPHRYASALFRNLGATFSIPPKVDAIETVPLPKLRLVGESPYLSRSRDRIAANSNAVFVTDVNCTRAGRYRVAIKGSGTPAGGQFPRVRVFINDREVGEVVTDSTNAVSKSTPPFDLPTGVFTLKLVYDNDALVDKQDRNLVLHQVGFTNP